MSSHEHGMQRAHLVLADGSAFPGFAIGATGTTVGEAVFTTGMTGYQEVLTDPSYCGQIVTMTAPQIGNTGVNSEDAETTKPSVAGFVVHELARVSSNWRSEGTLDAYLRDHGIVGISGVDTRALTRHLRDHGAQAAAIGCEDVATLHDRAKAAPSMVGRDLTAEVTTAETYEWSRTNGVWTLDDKPTSGLHVVAIDFGIKRNILRCLVETGCKVTVVPSSATAQDVLAHKPDGVFLSNGPGDPAAVTQGVETVRGLLGQKPLFGICLGHQLLSLALGGSTYKLKFGHRGLNQPVQDLETGRVEVTTQNHGFCVDVDSLKGKCELT
ncbi:MAG TPA: glutamine-hydrolyzing carbamoyl-phosphate synthase small subunit, partial [Polyangiales bacterium]|nr:glutamine-hydrolyzing carbamoyl-phosphate synthase small subunit [Polyangiales bacterium]